MKEELLGVGRGNNVEACVFGGELDEVAVILFVIDHQKTW